MLKTKILALLALLALSSAFAAAVCSNGNTPHYTTAFVSCCHCAWVPDITPANVLGSDGTYGNTGAYYHARNFNTGSCGDFSCFGAVLVGISEANCQPGYINCDYSSDTGCPSGSSCGSGDTISCGKYNGCETSCNSCTADSQCNDNNPCTRDSCSNDHCRVCKNIPQVPNMVADSCCPTGGYLNNDVDCTTCPAGQLNCSYGNNRICKAPSCTSDAQCGTGRTCRNPGTCTAACIRILGGDINVLSDGVEDVDGIDYEFVIFEYTTDDNRVNIYDTSDTLLHTNLRSGEYFNLAGITYRLFFENSYPYTLDVFKVSFYTRLTYNIFPVCGNGICETCESADNCLHYPPESCMACPADCPGLSQDEVDSYNDKFGSSITFGDTLANNDLACEVKTQSFGSTCNPLCVTHDFIDANGCLFNIYADSLPESSNGTVLGERTQSEMEWNNQELLVYSDAKGTINTGEFLGINNANCQENCECLHSNCNSGHCCPTGFEWSSSDPAADTICDGAGHVLASYKSGFSDSNGDGYIDETQGVSSNGRLDNSNAVSLADYFCTGNPARDKPSCTENMDPVCVYTEPDKTFHPIEKSGIYQCRKILSETKHLASSVVCTIHSHAWAKSFCHDYIFGLCSETTSFGLGGDSLYLHPFCVTDNPNECAATEGISSLLYDTQVVLKTITYEQFCTTPDLVCGSSKPFTNSQTGGTLRYAGCAQDESVVGESAGSLVETMTVGFYCSIFGNDFEKILNVDAGDTFKLISSNPLSGAEQTTDPVVALKVSTSTYTIGGTYYTNLDSYDHLLKYNNNYYVRINHVPAINRDSEEKLYHYLFNYETCKEIFKEAVPDCSSVEKNSMVFTTSTNGVNLFYVPYSLYAAYDEKGEPTNAKLSTITQYEGPYNDPLSGMMVKDTTWLGAYSLAPFSGSNIYRNSLTINTDHYSREFCGKFWAAYESKYGQFNWAYDSKYADFSGHTYNNIFKANPSLSLSSTVSFDGNNDGAAETYPIVSKCYELTSTILYCAPIIENSCLWWYKPLLDSYYSQQTFAYPVEPVWGKQVNIYVHSTNYYIHTQSSMERVRNNADCSTSGTSPTGLLKDPNLECANGNKCSANYPSKDTDGSCESSPTDPECT